MSDLWKKFKQFFEQAKGSSPSEPLVHEVIERSEVAQQKFEKWVGTYAQLKLSNWLNQQWVENLINTENTAREIDFLKTDSAQGFVIHTPLLDYKKTDWIHFLDFLKMQVEKHNYKVSLSDVRTYEKKDFVEMVQRHYLKPRIKIIPGQASNQLYGNIMIELIFKNDEPQRLKMNATVYKDYKFQDALEFGDLMTSLKTF